MRKNICKVLYFLIFPSLFIIGCSNNNQTTETSSQETIIEKEETIQNSSQEIETSTTESKDEYLLTLEQLVETLNQGIDLAYDNSILVFEVWKSALDQNNTSSEVSAFTQPYGEFVSPKEAIQLLSEDPTFKEKNEEIQGLVDTANNLVEEIENKGIPPKYVQLYQDAMKVDEFCNIFINYYPFNLIGPTYPRDLEYYDQSVPTFESWRDAAKDTIKRFYADEILYFE